VAARSRPDLFAAKRCAIDLSLVGVAPRAAILRPSEFTTIRLGFAKEPELNLEGVSNGK
jgi:hypothetical protein